MTAEERAASFALSTDGSVSLHESHLGGWLLVHARRDGHVESLFYHAVHQRWALRLEIRRLIPSPHDRTDFCLVLTGHLSEQDEPPSLSEMVWDTFADLAWVLTS